MSASRLVNEGSRDPDHEVGRLGLTQAALQAIRTDVFNVAAPIAP
jgi:hypothetical protein